jgi:hypothetical protein
MIYNLAKYITNNSSLTIVVNGFTPSSPNSTVCMNEGSGDERPWFDRTDTLVQFISRATDKTESRSNAYEIYDLIKKKYALALPEVTVGSTTYPAVTGWAIRPVSTPQYAFDDDAGRANYTFTVEVTTT